MPHPYFYTPMDIRTTTTSSKVKKHEGITFVIFIRRRMSNEDDTNLTKENAVSNEDMAELKKENAELKKENAELKKENAKLKEKINELELLISLQDQRMMKLTHDMHQVTCTRRNKVLLLSELLIYFCFLHVPFLYASPQNVFLPVSRDMNQPLHQERDPEQVIASVSLWVTSYDPSRHENCDINARVCWSILHGLRPAWVLESSWDRERGV